MSFEPIFGRTTDILELTRIPFILEAYLVIAKCEETNLQSASIFVNSSVNCTNV